jgi:hypothetical protein
MDDKEHYWKEYQRDMADEAKQAAKEICKEHGRTEVVEMTMLGGFKIRDNWTGEIYYDYDRAFEDCDIPRNRLDLDEDDLDED